MKYNNICIIIILICINSNLLGLKLPSVFSDNMVLQQNAEVNLWGWSEPGKTITVKASWGKYLSKTIADTNGKWKIKIRTVNAGGPYTIKISDDKNAIVLKNIMLGEVWLCSGQSNMEMPMKGFPGQPITNSTEDILYSSNNNIRIITIPRKGSSIPLDNFEGKWQIANPETVAEFSATAYYFGKTLHEILKVPIGLICVSYGGSCIQAWMTRENTENFENYNIPKPGDSIKYPNRTPSALFYGMLHPIVGYTIKGCIWYQGESNYREYDKYPELLKRMVNEWRNLWECGEFAFYYAQIAPYDYTLTAQGKSELMINSAYIREAQLKAQKHISNSGIIILLDTGEKECIHPANKKAAGFRFALQALVKSYNIKGIICDSPEYADIEIKDSVAIISFNNIGMGLTSYGKKLTQFEIAGEDKIFYPAIATLKRKSVEVYSPLVKKPVAVRYAFKDFVEAELFGTNGLPVSSFRTDNW